MTIYGLKLISTDGKEKIVTPDDATIIAAGSKTMSNSLEGDNTYGEDIALGATYNENELSVLVVPRRPVYGVNYSRFIDAGILWYATFYLDSTKTYYTRNSASGVMTSFSAGNKTVNNKSTWNPVLSVFPIAFWDKMGASTFSSVRLFAATAYLIRDTNNDTNFSLAGTASGVDYLHGTPPLIKDDDDSNWETGCGRCCAVSYGDSCAYNYSVEVDLGSAKTINKVEIDHQYEGVVNGGNYADGHWSIKLYYGGSWHEVMNDTWGAVGIVHTSHSLTGHWKGVTKIKCDAGGSAQASFNPITWSCHTTIELRAWGPPGSDGSENKTVYSIGNKGIATVDYMVSRKRFT